MHDKIYVSVEADGDQVWFDSEWPMTRPYISEQIHTAELARLYEVIADLADDREKGIALNRSKHAVIIAEARACKQTGELVCEQDADVNKLLGGRYKRFTRPYEEELNGAPDPSIAMVKKEKPSRRADAWRDM